ncbi:PspC domain-containing protein [Kitasatospora sp. NPDC096147]|uniref:PspC domain-containing protein n=1 Tax=Kitasatospora sp. NPDC096147 TaxID=3364093 RepID=UPI003828EB15
MTDDQTTVPGPAGAAAPEQPPRPPLTRSERHRVVAGVCGGLGRHLDIDPVVFRVVTAVLCLSGGLGLFLYGLAWLIVPREPEDGQTGRTELQRVLTGRVDGQSIGAVLLTVIGTGVFFSSMGDGGQLFPILLLGGLVLLAVRYDPERRRHPRVRGRRRGRGGPYDRLTDEHGHPYDATGGAPGWRTVNDPAYTDPSYTEPSGTEPSGRAAWWGQAEQQMKAAWRAHEEQMRTAFGHGTGKAHPDTPAAGPSGYLWDPRHPERNPYGTTPPPGAPAQPWWQRTDLPEGDPLRKADGPLPEPPEPPRCTVRPAGRTVHRGPNLLAPVGLLLAGLGGTLAWLVTDRQGGQVLLSTVLAAALAGIAVALLLGARYGRARGLVVPAGLLVLLLAATSGTDHTLNASVGDRYWAPTSVTEVRPEYVLGLGDLKLDLTDFDPAGTTVTSAVRLGAGDLQVTVPGDVEVRLTLKNGLGEIQVADRHLSAGVGNDMEYQLHPTNGRASRGTLDLTLSVGLGDLQVVQS